MKNYLDMINSEEYLKLYEYYNQKTFMDVLGVSRRENEHSNFLAWLFNPSENHGMGDYPLRKLLQTTAFRRTKDSKYSSNRKENLLQDKDSKYIDDLVYGNFKIESLEEITREKSISNKKRPDIYIKLKVTFFSTGKTETINFLIENKVTSLENCSQTVDYAKWLFDGVKNDGYAIPVYLMVATNEELKDLSDKPQNNEFMVLNYQYLMDGVFEPCLLNCKTGFGKSLLQEYVKCLGKAISEEGSSNERALVMATSQYEKNLVKLLWQNHKEALLEQFGNYNTDKNISSKELGPFYVAIAETLCSLMNSTQLASVIKKDLSDDEVNLILSMKKSKLGSKIFIYKKVEYKKGQRKDNNIGSLCRKLIEAYVSDKSFDDLEKKINDGGFKQNRWLRDVVIKEDDLAKLPKCVAPTGYDYKRKASECNQHCPNRPKDACCCIESFEDHFFKDFEIKTDTNKDNVKFYVAKYFTVENLERLIDDLGFTDKVTVM